MAAQILDRYACLFRMAAHNSHRPGYSHPSALLRCSPTQVLKFHVKAQVRVTPSLPRTPHGQYEGFRHALPGERGSSGLDVFSSSVTRPLRWFICIRLSNHNT